jgi:hypothetical protein
VIDGERDFVAEQLVGSAYRAFRNGLCWTPLETFRRRDRGGWDVTVPAVDFRAVNAAIEARAIKRLNGIEGQPFVGEDCTAFIERAFPGRRRLFADSPLLLALGIGVRIGDPALPLLKPDALLSPEARRLLQLDVIKNLPDAVADPYSPNARVWLLQRGLPALVLGAAVGALAARYSSASRRSTPASRTARRFLR